VVGEFAGRKGSGVWARTSRNFGVPAAHLAYPVPLLPSGPGGVRGTSLHRARSSTERSRGELRLQIQSSIRAGGAPLAHEMPAGSGRCERKSYAQGQILFVGGLPFAGWGAALRSSG